MTTPDIGSVFGNKVTFAVFFKKVYSKVAVTLLEDYVYGPIIYNPKNYGNSFSAIQNPSLLSGSLGGGDLINIYGCGLSQFNATQYTVYYNELPFCQTGSLRVVSVGNQADDYLQCVTNAVPCGEGDNVGDISISLITDIPSVADPQILPYEDEQLLTFQAGPVVNADSISSTRGPRIGGQLVSVEGQNFFYAASNNAENPGWSVTVNFVDPTDSDVIIPSVPATFVSDTQLSFVTPVGLFDLDVVVSFDFGTTCPGYPRTSDFPSYHFGPVCSEVTPANGYWSGGSDVTVVGEGFEEDNNLPSDTFVRMCIERISTPDKCAFEEVPRDSFHLNDTQITFVTPSARQNVLTKVGDNRLFGDIAQVWVHFYQAGGEFIEFPRNQLRPGLEVARIQCPNPYTFSPVVTTVTPSNGQVVPRANPVPLTVTVNGEYFEDPALKNEISVTFDGLLTVDPSIASDNTATAGITWGLTAGHDSDVQVIFDNGNRTYSGINIGFGPAIYSIASAKLGAPIISANNLNGDIYGLFPAGGETIIVTGEGFAAYNGSIKCTIGGDDAAYFLDSDTQIRCITPCKSYGSVAQLSLSFGRFCSANEINWEDSVAASQFLYYNPRLDSFSPAFGKTTGGDTVTIKGEGFAGWGKYECFFGHYSDQQHVIPSADGTTLVCKTPINRAEFNTYVTVSVQLSAYDDDDSVETGYVEDQQSCSNGVVVVDESIYAGVENHDFSTVSLFAQNKFYYGPVCNDISPSSCPLTGCVAAVVGSGFQDCNTGNQTVYTKTYPYNDCTFRYYRVRYVDPVTKDFSYVNAPTNDTLSPGNSNTKLFFYAPSHECGYEPEIEIEFYSPVVSTEPSSNGAQSQTVVKCTHPESRSYTFHYGPVFATQSSTYYQSSTSYGWSGDSVTITGIDFRDPSIFGSVTCNFGDDVSVAAASVNTAGSTVVCQVPSVSTSHWNTVVDISLTWSGSQTTCPPLYAQQFHFGPVIRSITPTRGYVAGEEPVTISGYAFGCCGITSYSCLFPEVSPPKVDDTVKISANSVTCTVPKNNAVDVQINNIGVAFTSSLFGTQDITLTEDNASLQYYYGPYVTGYTPSHSTLSGRDQYVVIQGEGFADPYLYETFCDFFNETSPGFEFVPIEPLEEVFITDTTITCAIPLFAHYAEAVDKIRPRWRRYYEELRPELNKNYYKTIPPTTTVVAGAPYFSDGGSTTPFYLEGFKYGPVITSVCVGTLCNDELPRSLVTGGLEVTVSFDSLRDFVSNSTTKDFGSQTALCVFGNRVADQLSPIVADPNSDNGGTVVCVTPHGDFAFDGEISVLLNPLISADTLSAAQFHSKPYTAGISRNWVSSAGFETIVVYGSGFCQYTTVKCSFANGASANDATQGDITNDKMVTCRTPSRAAGYSSLSLQFCSEGDFEVCNCGEEKDFIHVPEKITFYGITDVTPNEGSFCGGTTISYSGYGFSNFDKITCAWPNSGIQVANIINDNLFTCNSIDVSSIFNNDIVHCSDVTVVGIRTNTYYPIDVPNKFEYGVPEIIAITPNTVSMQSLGTITVQGLYFNGNGYDISCEFSGFVPSVGTLVADSNDNYYVLCNVPADITLGTYDFALSVGCSSTVSYRTNTVHLTVNQSPIIQKVRPIAGPELGGQTITIEGTNFNGGSVYVCVFGALAVGANYDEESSTITCKTPAFLDTVEDVKVPLYISLDGGEHLFRSKDDYIYQNIAVVQDDNVCVKEEDLNEGSNLSVSLFFTIIFICISLTL